MLFLTFFMDLEHLKMKATHLKFLDLPTQQHSITSQKTRTLKVHSFLRQSFLHFLTVVTLNPSLCELE